MPDSEFAGERPEGLPAKTFAPMSDSGYAPSQRRYGVHAIAFVISYALCRSNQDSSEELEESSESD